jgi:hypothetical protein
MLQPCVTGCGPSIHAACMCSIHANYSAIPARSMANMCAMGLIHLCGSATYPWMLHTRIKKNRGILQKENCWHEARRRKTPWNYFSVTLLFHINIGETRDSIARHEFAMTMFAVIRSHSKRPTTIRQPQEYDSTV